VCQVAYVVRPGGMEEGDEKWCRGKKETVGVGVVARGGKNRGPQPQTNNRNHKGGREEQGGRQVWCEQNIVAKKSRGGQKLNDTGTPNSGFT